MGVHLSTATAEIPVFRSGYRSSGWGVVVFAQAIGMVIASVVEYGCDISASPETSRQRNP
jgi:hypothetical protein